MDLFKLIYDPKSWKYIRTYSATGLKIDERKSKLGNSFVIGTS